MAQQLLPASLELALPALVALGLRRWLGVELWRQGLYGLLPLLLALLLARHLPVGMGEAGQFLPVSLGASWPSSGWQSPTLTSMALTRRACLQAASANEPAA